VHPENGSCWRKQSVSTSWQRRFVMFQSCRLQSDLKEDGPDRSLLCFVSINGYTHRLGPQYSAPRQRQSPPWQSRSHRKANPLDCFVPLLAALCEVSPPFASGKVGYPENPAVAQLLLHFASAGPPWSSDSLALPGDVTARLISHRTARRGTNEIPVPEVIVILPSRFVPSAFHFCTFIQAAVLRCVIRLSFA